VDDHGFRMPDPTSTMVAEIMARLDEREFQPFAIMLSDGFPLRNPLAWSLYRYAIAASNRARAWQRLNHAHQSVAHYEARIAQACGL